MHGHGHPGGPGGHGPGGHRPPMGGGRPPMGGGMPPRPPMGGGMWHRRPPRRYGGCGGCLFPVIGVIALVVTMIAFMI